MNPSHMRRYYSILILLVSVALSLKAQNPKLLWQKAIGGPGYDNGMKLIPVDHGCFLVGGQSSSNQGFGEKNHSAGEFDMVVARVSAEGHVVWRTFIGGTRTETFSDMKATPDGGAILIGTTQSIDYDAATSHGKREFLLAKVDRIGRVEWTKCYGGVGNDKGYAVTPISTGGYLIAGESGSRTGTMTFSRGGLDAWAALLDAEGNVLLEKSFGGSGNDKATIVHELKKDRYLVVCTTNSHDGDVKDPLGAKDVWVVCLSKNFDIVWQRTYGGSDFDDAHSITSTRSGDLVLCGTTFSEDKDLDLATNHGLGDSWAFRITSQGNLRWSQTYGGAKSEGGNAITETPDGGFILVGTSNSRDRLVPTNKGLYDGWMVRTDSLGKQIWAGTFGGPNFEYLYDVMALEDGNYLALGFAESTKGDLLPTKKDIGNDFWFIRFADPDDPTDNVLRSSNYLTGAFRSESNGMPIGGQVVISNNDDLSVTSKAENEPSTGIYQVDLPESGKYSVMYTSPGFMFFGQDIDFGLLAGGPEIRIDASLLPIKVGSKVILNNIKFDVGKADIRAESEPELNRLLFFLKMNRDVKVEISGHTDNTGTPEGVKSLSKLRATRVRDWLLKAGISGRQMQVAGYGMERPVADNDTKQGRQKNRRVECEVVELL